MLHVGAPGTGCPVPSGFYSLGFAMNAESRWRQNTKCAVGAKPRATLLQGLQASSFVASPHDGGGQKGLEKKRKHFQNGGGSMPKSAPTGLWPMYASAAWNGRMAAAARALARTPANVNAGRPSYGRSATGRGL